MSLSAAAKYTLALLVITASLNAATNSWSGAVNNLWSVAGNWTGGVPPVAGDTLVFPTSGATKGMTNDLPAGLALQSLSFSSAANYALNGNAITLSGGITNGAPQFTIAAPITLTASQTFDGTGLTVLAGPIDLNSFTLTLSANGTTVSGSLIGSGAVVINRGGVNLTGTSSFSGAMTVSAAASLNVAGTITNATLGANGTQISGAGTIATASLTNSSLSAGNFSGTATGILSTGDLSIQGGSVKIDLVNPTAGSGYDQINTTGTVTLGNPSLQVLLPSNSPGIGQSFIIINNDGIDPVVGTFNGLPEGSSVTVGPTQFRISYVGGTGNDVVLTVVASSKAWTGAVNNLWSVAGNWNGGVVPVAGDALFFLDGAATKGMTNDLPAGLALQSLSFSSQTNYALNGNGIALSGGFTNDAPQFTIAAPITLTASQTFGGTRANVLAGPIDLNGFMLTLSANSGTTVSGSLNGSGAVLTDRAMTLTGTSTFSGTMTVSAGLNVTGTITNTTLVSNGGQISGTGTTATTSLINGSLSPGNFAGNTGVLSTGNLSIQGASVIIDLVSPTPGSGHDQINTTGTITLANASLQASLPSKIPTLGQAFVIVNNDGTDPVGGIFNALPEGAIVTAGPTQFRISYVGGTGNDVVLTVVATAKAWTGLVNNLWSVGGNWNGGVPPVAGDALVFPLGASTRGMTNDLPAGLVLQSLSFPSTANYALNGNGFSLSAGLTSLGSPVTIAAPMTLTASQTFDAGGTTFFAGPIDLNGFTLTLAAYNTTISGSLIGAGAVVINRGGVNLTGTSTVSGTMTVSSQLTVNGTITNTTLVSNGGQISGAGTTATTSLINSSLSPGTFVGNTAVLSTGDLSIQGGSVTIDLVNPTPGTGYDQINTIGTITLANPALQVSLPSRIPPIGESFVILNHDGVDPVVGIFNGLPEGAIVTAGPTQFRISYVGGTGNDVVLEAVAAPVPVPALGDLSLYLLLAVLAFVAMRALGKQ